MVDKQSKNIAVIPARGGSKRIPEKNIIEFSGQPLISWTIQAAQQSQCFDRIVVSTDDPKIAAVAEKYGVEVPFYRDQASDDITPVSEATLLAVSQAEEHWQESYDTVVQLMANCPLRSAQSIQQALSFFYEQSTHFLLSAFKFGWMNPWWASTLNEHHQPSPLFPEAMKRRSQDLEELFCPTGAIWIADVKHLKKSRTFYGDGHLFYPIPWTEAVDIDDYDDLKMANAVAYLLKQAPIV